MRYDELRRYIKEYIREHPDDGEYNVLIMVEVIMIEEKVRKEDHSIALDTANLANDLLDKIEKRR
jgi:hypothetical protein